MSTHVIEQSSPAFGALLRELRLRAGLSQEALAERSRLSTGAISALERGARRAPYRSSVDLLANGLGLAPSEHRRLHDAATRRRGPRGTAVGDYPSARSMRGILPAPLNRFHGREREVTALCELIASRRLVTLCGAGGVGKTRLAVEVAARHADVFTAGVHFVDLAPVSDGSLVTAAAAMALDVSERPGNPVLEDITLALEDRSAMIVFDNCEHMLTAVTPLIVRILGRCRDVRIVATSREPLRVDGEVVLTLEGLAVAADGPDALAPAERLFIDRAADAGVALDTLTERAAVTLICRRLDGIPLAIELAASRIRALSASQIASALDERFALLEDFSPTRTQRHRTLAGTLDWSHDLLSDEEKALFRRLAVFPSSWTFDAAQAVCEFEPLAPDRMMAVHASLVDRSLISVTRAGESYRYHFGETLYQYAQRRLSDAGEQGMAVAALIERAVDETGHWAAAFGGPTEAAALAHVDAEYPNLRATVAYAEQQPAHHRSAHRIVQNLCDYWLIRGAITEGLAIARRVLRTATTEVPPGMEGRTRLVLSRFLRVHQEISEAESLDNATLATALREHDRKLEAEARIALAGNAFYEGRYDAAYDLDTEAAAILREGGDSEPLGRTLHNLGAIATLLRRYDEADAYLAESEAILRRIDDRRGLAWVAFRRGFRATAIGDFAGSERYFTESLALRRATDDRSGIAGTLLSLGTLHIRRKRFAEAAKLLASCLETSRAHGFTMLVIETAERTAQLAFLCGETAEACAIFAHAGALRDRLRAPMEPLELSEFAEPLELMRERERAARAGEHRPPGQLATVDALAVAASSLLLQHLVGGGDNVLEGGGGRDDGP